MVASVRGAVATQLFAHAIETAGAQGYLYLLDFYMEDELPTTARVTGRNGVLDRDDLYDATPQDRMDLVDKVRVSTSRRGTLYSLLYYPIMRKAVVMAATVDANADGAIMNGMEWSSLVASARLHRLDPEAYFRDVLRVLPHWPRDRYLELAPRYWLATRARLDPGQLELEIGPLDVPPPPSSEQPATR